MLKMCTLIKEISNPTYTSAPALGRDYQCHFGRTGKAYAKPIYQRLYYWPPGDLIAHVFDSGGNQSPHQS
jgi:hypothetical protein